MDWPVFPPLAWIGQPYLPWHGLVSIPFLGMDWQVFPPLTYIGESSLPLHGLASLPTLEGVNNFRFAFRHKAEQSDMTCEKRLTRTYTHT